MGSILETQGDPSTTSPNTMDREPYTIKEEPLGSLRPLRIITIGAGVSGLNMIRALKLHTTNISHVVYEKNVDIGGTWYENRYPGCRCDIPAHNYQFSHTPNLGWSNLFAPAEEIEEYLRHVCEVHGLRGFVKVRHSVVAARWEEKVAEWIVEVKNEVTGEVFEDRCQFLLDASGILNKWKWPSTKGLHSFKGDLIHSASWPETFDYKGKRVAVFGNGASGVQIMPALQPDVEKLVHVIRSPTWITPPQQQMIARSPNAEFISSIQMDSDENFTAEQIEEFKNEPEKYRKFVKAVEKEINSRFKMLINGTPEAMMARKMLTGYMGAMLRQNEQLMKELIPDYSVGCRRMTPGVGYLNALSQPNVQLVSDAAIEVVSEGLKLSNGETIEVDAIICATGFDTSFIPRFPLTGTNGNLQEIWKDTTPAAYMSCMIPGLPNYFTFLGPHAPIGHGSVLTITEHLAKYIIKVIKKCQIEHTLSIRPLQSAVDDYFEHIATFMPRTAWAAPCGSWFKGKDGKVTALHPGSRIHWFHMLESPRWEDFEWRSERKNRFAYLGNGFSTKEAEGEDPTWYLDEPDAL